MRPLTVRRTYTRIWVILVSLLLPNAKLFADDPQSRTRHDGDHYGRLAFSPSGEQLADGSLSGKIRIWDIGKRQVVRVLQLAEKRIVQYLAWSPDGKRLAVGGFGMQTAMHDVVSGKMTARAQRNRSQRLGNINGLGWSLDGASLLLAYPRAFAIWDAGQSSIHESSHKLPRRFTAGTA